MKVKPVDYSPQLFLSSLGNGGLAVSFFMYLMFLVPHPTTHMPTFFNIMSILQDSNYFVTFLTLTALLLILYFSYKHFMLLFLNLSHYKSFINSEESQTRLKEQPFLSSFMPLTLGMTINVLFILGVVFIPNIWNYVEYLFPLAITSFLALGVLGLKIFLKFLSSIFTHSYYNFLKQNNLSNLSYAMMFAMIGVGLAAPAAMSHNLATTVIAEFSSFFFLILTFIWTLIVFIAFIPKVFEHGINLEASPTLLVPIPILTLTGIGLFRNGVGFATKIINNPASPWLFLVMFSLFLLVQIIFAFIGIGVMHKNNYIKRFVLSNEKTVSLYALVCPLVAIFVLSMFFVHKGLVETKLIDKYSNVHLSIIVVLFILQFFTIRLLNKINKKFV